MWAQNDVWVVLGQLDLALLSGLPFLGECDFEELLCVCTHPG
jgi:hypothetical protein